MVNIKKEENQNPNVPWKWRTTHHELTKALEADKPTVYIEWWRLVIASGYPLYQERPEGTLLI